MGKKDGMYFYCDWLTPLEKLEKAEVGELVLSMMRYFVHGEKPPKFEGLCGMAADFIFPQIDRSMEYAKLGSRGGIATREKSRSRAKKAEEMPFVFPEADDSPIIEDTISAEELDALSTKEALTRFEEKQRKKKEKEGIKKEAPPPPPKSEEKPLSFEERLFRKEMLECMFYKFWREYPNKSGRPKAQEAFVRLAPDNKLFDKMMAALKAQKTSDRWKKEDGRYIPFPENWIENRRWEDEGAETEKEEKSFDVDDFFSAAMECTYGSKIPFSDGIKS